MIFIINNLHKSSSF